MIFPEPKKQFVTGSFSVLTASVSVSDSDAASMFSECGIEISESARINVSVIYDCSEKLTYTEESSRLTDEKFIIVSTAEDDRLFAEIKCSGKRSLRYAVGFLAEKIKTGTVETGTVEDYPLFAVRGYIEGFYGKPWSFENRKNMLALMAKKRMNTYYYAPKDDVFHREKWRELYSGKESENLRSIVSLCKDLCVDFHYCIAPGLSMCYSSEKDYADLMNKLKSIYEFGVKGFGLLLDDIPAELYYEEDRNRFGETVNAHIYLANRLYNDLRALDENITLTLCPLQYHGNGDEYFISKLGRGIESRIRLFWTGKNICSQELTSREAVIFENATYHKPLYWDNFPVNDAEMYNEMHLGYLNGRDEELYRHCEGLISNCMEYCVASEIPLMTVADYLWNPKGYCGMDSWHNAIKEITGDDFDSFIYFADNLLTSCLKTENSPLFNAVTDRVHQAISAGDFSAALNLLEDYFIKLSKCCETVKTGDNPLYRELGGWADKQEFACNLLGETVELLRSPSEQKRETVKRMLHEYNRIPETLCDFSFQCLIERILQL